MRRSEDFSGALRGGVRGASRTLVVHLNADLTKGDPLVGFAVSRAVGNSVVRHRVQRRLRHLMRDVVPGLPAGARIVVRALPAAAGATYDDLGGDLARAVEVAGRRAGHGGGRVVRRDGAVSGKGSR